MWHAIRYGEGRCLSALLALLLLVKCLFPAYVSLVSLTQNHQALQPLLICSSLGFKYITLSDETPEEGEVIQQSDCVMCGLFASQTGVLPQDSVIEWASYAYPLPSFVTADSESVYSRNYATPLTRAPPVIRL